MQETKSLQLSKVEFDAWRTSGSTLSPAIYYIQYARSTSFLFSTSKMVIRRMERSNNYMDV